MRNEMGEHVEVDWASMPPDVKVWYLEQLDRQEQAEAALAKEEEGRRGQRPVSGPMKWGHHLTRDGLRVPHVPPEIDRMYHRLPNLKYPD